MLSDALKSIAKAYAAKCLDANGDAKKLTCGSCRRECENLRKQAESGNALDVAGAFARGAATYGKNTMDKAAKQIRAIVRNKSDLTDVTNQIKQMALSEGLSNTDVISVDNQGVLGVRITGTPPTALANAPEYKGFKVTYAV